MAFSAIGLAIAIGGTAASAYSSSRQADREKKAMSDQKQQQQAMIQQQQQAQAQQDQKLQQQASMEAARQRAQASGFAGASSQTTFTNPLGMPGAAPTAKSSLLGI